MQKNISSSWCESRTKWNHEIFSKTIIVFTKTANARIKRNKKRNLCLLFVRIIQLTVLFCKRINFVSWTLDRCARGCANKMSTSKRNLPNAYFFYMMEFRKNEEKKSGKQLSMVWNHFSSAEFKPFIESRVQFYRLKYPKWHLNRGR